MQSALLRIKKYSSHHPGVHSGVASIRAFLIKATSTSLPPFPPFRPTCTPLRASPTFSPYVRQKCLRIKSPLPAARDRERATTSIWPSIYLSERDKLMRSKASHTGACVLAALLFLSTSCKAQTSEWTSYSETWDWSNAGSKLDAVTKARQNSLLALFAPTEPTTGVQSSVSNDTTTICLLTA